MPPRPRSLPRCGLPRCVREPRVSQGRARGPGAAREAAFKAENGKKVAWERGERGGHPAAVLPSPFSTSSPRPLFQTRKTRRPPPPPASPSWVTTRERPGTPSPMFSTLSWRGSTGEKGGEFLLGRQGRGDLGLGGDDAHPVLGRAAAAAAFRLPRPRVSRPPLLARRAPSRAG